MESGQTRLSPTRWVLLVLIALAVMSCRGHDDVVNRMRLALFTDFGRSDAYVAQMKGAIWGVDPGAEVVDLSHEVPSFDVRHAAWLLEKSVRYLPPETVVVAVVDPGVGGARQPVALRTRSGRIYIGPDNGIFTAVVQREKLDQARQITNEAWMRPGQRSATFHGRDIFGPVAAHLALGRALEEAGPVLKELRMLPWPVPVVLGDRVTGEVMHIDGFGNILTNITVNELGEPEKERLVKVTLGSRTVSLPLLTHYEAAPARRPFALISSDGELEIALREGSAAAALKAERGQRVVVQR